MGLLAHRSRCWRSRRVLREQIANFEDALCAPHFLKVVCLGCASFGALSLALASIATLLPDVYAVILIMKISRQSDPTTVIDEMPTKKAMVYR
jgi:hypothetical protein